MSAIFGMVDVTGQPVTDENLKHLSKALAHHGSDGGSIWAKGSIGLGQRQMCFTPEDHLERQPLISGDRRYILVSDGRIDNRRELMREFGDRAFVDPLPDSAFILRAYEKWGDDCVHHLIGSFTFSLWDAQTERLVIVRSPITAPSLFYFKAPQIFAFATMPKGLFALPFIPCRIDEEKLADILVMSNAKPTATMYRNIHRLPTGHRLILSREGLKVQRYWQPDLKKTMHFSRDEEYVEAFDEILDRVVADSLRSGTPVGMLLSGGLDSSTLATKAVRLLESQGKRLTAFTEIPRAGFDGPVPEGRYADETPLVQAIARKYDSLDLNLIRTDGRTFLDDLERMFFHLEMPFRNTFNRVWIEAILQEAQQRGIRVILDGAQGNITASWIGSGLLPELLRAGKWRRAWQEASAMVRCNHSHSLLRTLAGQGLKPLLPPPLGQTAEWLLRNKHAFDPEPWRNNSPIHPDFAAAQRVTERAREANCDFHFRCTANSRKFRCEALAQQDSGSYHSMQHSIFGVDTRSPLADVRLAEFCLAIPEDQYLRNGESRALVRRAMAGKLPPQVLMNRRRGLQAADWFERGASVQNKLAAALKQLESCDLARRVLDLARMHRLFEQWPKVDRYEERIANDYGRILMHGITVGRFLQWFENRNFHLDSYHESNEIGKMQP